MRPIFPVLMATAMALAGCLTDEQRMAMEREPNEGGVMRGTFDPAEASFVLAPATAAVRGRFYQVLSDGTVPGKFGTIKLIPDTPYAREHMERLFRGACSYSLGMLITGIDPRYLANMRVTRADQDGNFELLGIPDGTYIVYAYRTSENVYFANRAAVTVSGQNDVTVDVGCQ